MRRWRIRIHTPIVIALYEVEGLQPLGTNLVVCLICKIISIILDADGKICYRLKVVHLIQ